MANFILVVSTLLLLSTTTTSQTLDSISDKFRYDGESIKIASTDYGHIIEEIPDAVFLPTSPDDIQTLIKIVNDDENLGTDSPLSAIAPRGQGHSVRGQAMARNGIVVNMTSLDSNGIGINVVASENSNDNNNLWWPYVDVGGGQIWVDVLRETLKFGLSPVSWTDYLHLSVGGTLSNAGISGQTFKFGPQISNVYELDVITGKGDLVTCSRYHAPELFNAVLGGLGQFGIITRARIALAPAPTRVKWLKLMYNDFSAFKRDQEKLISRSGMGKNGVNYLEGFLLMRQGPLDLSFYPTSDQLRITSLVTQSGIVYVMELVKYYDQYTQNNVDKALQVLLNQLSFVPGFAFKKDVTYFDFLNRVGSQEPTLQERGLWEIPHPWLNLFVPASRMSDFDSGVFRGILLEQKVPAGLVIVYPMNRNKWNLKTSVVTPDEDVFYAIGFLHSSSYSEWEKFDEVNKQILQFCQENDIEFKQYFPHYETQEDWEDHFGTKWEHFQQMKTQFDPKKILSPGQKIFNT